MRFPGLGLADRVPDANTIWTFRETLKKADAIDSLFRRFDEALRSQGFLAMSGQIGEATWRHPSSATRSKRRRRSRKAGSRRLEGHARQACPEGPGRALDGEIHESKPCEDGSLPAADLAFGYKNHVSIDRGFGLIRKWTTTPPRARGRGSKTCWIGRTRPATFGRTHRLSVGEEQSDAGAARVRVAHPSQEAAGSVERMRSAKAQKSKVRSAVKHRHGSGRPAPSGP